MKTTLAFAALAFGALVTLAPAQQMSYQGRITDNAGNPVAGNQTTLTFNIYDSATGDTVVWGPFSRNADLIDSRFSIKLGPSDETTPSRSLADAFAGGGNRFIEVAVSGQAPLPRQEVLATPTSLSAVSSLNLATVNGIVATAEDSLLHAPEQVLVGRNTLTGTLSPFSIKAPSSASQVDPAGGLRLIEDDNSTAWQVFYDTSNDDLGFNYDNGATSTSQLSLSREGDLDVGGDLSADGIINASTNLFVGGNLSVFGATSLDGFTSQGNGRINGKLTVNSNPTSNIAMTVQETSDDDFLFWFADQNATQVFSLQSASTNTQLRLTRGNAFKPNGGAWASTSDRRVKKNIEELQGSLEQLEQLNPVTFSYLEENKFGVTGTQIGFVAQEVETVFPHWVGESENPLYNPEDPKSQQPEFAKFISISGFEALATAAIQELRAEKDTQLEELRSSNSQTMVSLEQENAALKTRLAELEQQFGTLVKTVESLKAPTKEDMAGTDKAVSLAE